MKVVIGNHFHINPALIVGRLTSWFTPSCHDRALIVQDETCVVVTPLSVAVTPVVQPNAV